MKPLLLAFAVASVGLASGAGCRAAPEASGAAAEAAIGAPSGEPFVAEYRVALALNDVEGRWRVTLNGFPIWDRSDAPARTKANWIDPTLNAALVNTGNVLRVEVWPAVRFEGGGLAIGATDIEAEVVRVGSGAVAGTALGLSSSREAWSAELRDRYASWLSADAESAADSVRAWASSHGVWAEVQFDEGDGQTSFDAVFRDAPVIAGTPADSARLRQYAVHLRDIMVARDTAAAMTEFAPAIADLFRYSGTPLDSTDFYKLNQEGAIMAPLLMFEIEEVELRSWSGGRVWELSHGGGPLFRTVGGQEMDAYVGEVNGALRVVR